MSRTALRLGLLALLGAASGCTPASSAPSGAPPSPSIAASASADDGAGLRVELKLATARVARIADLHATITLTNTAPAPRRLRVEYVRAGNLSLEVQDPAGQRVPPLPPPVPHVDDGVTGWTTLAPGESRSYECSASIGIDVPDGRYRVRFRGVPGDATAGNLQSGWVSFDVGK